jgi:predicted secreted protein
MEVIDTSTKDSNAWRSILAGMRSGTMSVSGLIDYQGSYYDTADLFSAFTGQTPLTLKFSNQVDGDRSYTATGYISSLEQSAGTEDTASYSATFELSGQIQEDTISNP